MVIVSGRVDDLALVEVVIKELDNPTIVEATSVKVYPLRDGDARSVSIAAASILAKVHRDALLQELDRQFPGYGLARHKGYATRYHLDQLRRQGPTPFHRRSFAPVRECLALLEAMEQNPLPF